MSNEHFDGLLHNDNRSPNEFLKIDGVQAVLVDPNTGRIVITGKPNDSHNCDQRGCGSVEHKIGEFHADKELFEPIRNVIEE